MNTNILVIFFSGISISLLSLFLLLLPESGRQYINENIEFFLTIPPVVVASYVLVFKYLENFQAGMPPVIELVYKIFQGSIAVFIFFFVTAVLIGLLLRSYNIYFK